MFGWALRTGRLDTNPMAGLGRPRAPTRDRVLGVPELRAVFAAAGDTGFGRIVRLMIVTGCRRDEVGWLRWEEVVGDTLRLPATRTKNHRAHDVPVPDAGLLPPRRPGWPFVFGQTRRAGFSGWSRCILADDILDSTRRNGSLQDAVLDLDPEVALLLHRRQPIGVL